MKVIERLEKQTFTLKCAIFADILDLENGCSYLNTIASKKRKKKHGFLVFLFKSKHHFIDLNESLSYIRTIMGEKIC